YIHSKSPNEPVIANNLAQAYAALGATDEAMNYINKCLQLLPNHPEANYTAARIEAAKGNRQLAIEYSKKSLEGGYTNGAYSLLSKLNPPKEKLDELLSHIDVPDDFDAYKFELPRQQLLLSEADQIIREHEIFRKSVLAATNRLNDLVLSYEAKGQTKMKELDKDPMLYLKNKDRYFRPLSSLGMTMLHKYGQADNDKTIDKTFHEKLQEIETKNAKTIEEQTLVLLDENRKSGGINTGTNVAELIKLADYYRTKSAEVRNAIISISATEEKQTKKLNALQQQLAELRNNPNQQLGQLVLQLMAKESTNASYNVSYVTPSATWLASYDIKAVNTISPLAIVYKGAITQSTGLDWKKVKLSL
ncbi:MAG: DUF4139 domain-containing protein, partial [Flavobacterium sp.]